ncbi:hypothetical protein ACFY41_03805 [Streptomyces syringium]|uniref:hypothetical protein n=1 Tax=Streptomyces syringium TaxID=76729 RepID=UPI00368434EC
MGEEIATGVGYGVRRALHGGLAPVLDRDLAIDHQRLVDVVFVVIVERYAPDAQHAFHGLGQPYSFQRPLPETMRLGSVVRQLDARAPHPESTATYNPV